jgi:ElaB/YqjD/DUF883 family membrane-anchored ribosome-binding protein
MIDRMHDVESGYGPQVEELKAMALEYAATARERLAERSERIKEYVTNEPLRAVVVALGVGVLLGWLIKRR